MANKTSGSADFSEKNVHRMSEKSKIIASFYPLPFK